MFKTLLVTMQKQFANRRRYNQLLSEIDDLSQRDLTDMRATRDEMRRYAWLSVYGDD